MYRLEAAQLREVQEWLRGFEKFWNNRSTGLKNAQKLLLRFHAWKRQHRSKTKCEKRRTKKTKNYQSKFKEKAMTAKVEERVVHALEKWHATK